MLLRGLTWLVLFQLLGTALNVLLFADVAGPDHRAGPAVRDAADAGRGGESLPLAASSLLRYLPLLLVPPAVGVMAYTEAILDDFWAIIGVLVVSLVVSLVFTGVLMQALIRRQQRKSGRA